MSFVPFCIVQALNHRARGFPIFRALNLARLARRGERRLLPDACVWSSVLVLHGVSFANFDGTRDLDRSLLPALMAPLTR
jgi:hypothetical protein